jgi:5-methyltetrahydrofolate--homocysteine methyltransferase
MPENVNGKAIYKLSPTDMASEMKEFITNYEFVRIVGGCCGTSPAHILELRHTIDEKK